MPQYTETEGVEAGGGGGARKFKSGTAGGVVKVNPDRADLVETRVIDGRRCLVIAVDDHIEVNGINVRTIKRPANGEYNGSTEAEA